MAKISQDEDEKEPEIEKIGQIEPVGVIKPMEQLIYIGPNLPGGTLQRYAVFKGGLPLHATEVIEKCPAINGLFIPVADFARAEQAVKTVGTVENTLFNVVVDHVRGGK